MTDAALLQATALTKTYGSRIAVERISLRIAPGELVGLFGRNGDGKSTICGMISGLVEPDGGAIRFRGEEITTQDAAWRSRLGIRCLPQESGFVPGQRLERGRTLAASASLLILDEPFNGVPPEEVAELQEWIRSLRGGELAVLLADHNIRDSIGLCDRAYVLHQGRVLIQGPPGAILPERRD